MIFGTHKMVVHPALSTRPSNVSTPAHNDGMADGPMLEIPEISEDTPSAVPLTLAQRARAAQELWAAAYAERHRVRRSACWLVAIILSLYVSGCAFQVLASDDLFDRLGLAAVAGYGPLVVIMWASLDRLKGGRSGPSWAFAWAFVLADAAAGASGLFPRGEYLLGALYVVSALGIGAVLLWGLHIPDDPSVDWNLVVLERLTVVRSAHGGHSYPSIIDSPRKAEEIAAAWLRRLGYPDALVTQVGADHGKDTESFGAVAQVKWRISRATEPQVRDLAGSGKPGQARFFFSKSGYTKPALWWATDLEHPVQLFIMGDDGNILACNYRARRSLWHAPPHVPVASRLPASRGSIWLSVIGGTSSFLSAISFVYIMLHTFHTGRALVGVTCGVMALTLAFMSIRALFLPVIRITRNVRERQPPEIGKSFRGPRLPEIDRGLPPDAFIGFAPDPIGRVLDLGVDLWVFSRAVHRVFRGRSRART
jgi:hypothetical protein